MPSSLFLFVTLMIHFNDLSISDDGKHLNIDVEIDDMSAFDMCYIDSIKVIPVEDCDNYCNTKGTVVYTGSTGLTYVDMDGDGQVSKQDIALIDKIQDLIVNGQDGNDESKYDINGDGIVDLRDYKCIVDVILGKKDDLEFYPKTVDVTGDGEKNIADLNDFNNYMISKLNKDNYSQDDWDLLENTEDDEGIVHSSKLSDYQSFLRDNNVVKKESDPPKQHISLCLTPFEVFLQKGKTFTENLFVVEVTARCDGNAAEIAQLGCGWDNNTIKGLVYYDKNLYDEALNLANSYSDDCDNNDSSRFVDFILRYYAFMFAVKSGNVKQACYYWNNYLRNYNSKIKSTFHRGGCGCHGAHW